MQESGKVKLVRLFSVNIFYSQFKAQPVSTMLTGNTFMNVPECAVIQYLTASPIGRVTVGWSSMRVVLL